VFFLCRRRPDLLPALRFFLYSEPVGGSRFAALTSYIHFAFCPHNLYSSLMSYFLKAVIDSFWTYKWVNMSLQIAPKKETLHEKIFYFYNCYQDAFYRLQFLSEPKLRYHSVVSSCQNFLAFHNPINLSQLVQMIEGRCDQISRATRRVIPPFHPLIRLKVGATIVRWASGALM